MQFGGRSAAGRLVYLFPVVTQADKLSLITLGKLAVSIQLVASAKRIQRDYHPLGRIISQLHFLVYFSFWVHFYLLLRWPVQCSVLGGKRSERKKKACCWVWSVKQKKWFPIFVSLSIRRLLWTDFTELSESMSTDGNHRCSKCGCSNEQPFDIIWLASNRIHHNGRSLMRID